MFLDREDMKRVQDILHLLLEAKTYRNHIRKSQADEITKRLKGVLGQPGLKSRQVLVKHRVIDADTLIDFVEEVYRNYNNGRSYQILIKYVPWTINNLLDKYFYNIDLIFETYPKHLLRYDELLRDGVLRGTGYESINKISSLAKTHGSE